MRKRLTAIALTAMIVLSSAACGSQSSPVTSAAPTESKIQESQTNAESATGGTTVPERKNMNISFAAGPANGANYTVATGISNLMSQTYDNYTFVPEITNGSAENVRLIQQGSSQIGCCQSDSMYYAYLGEREFDESTKGCINFVMMGNEVCLTMLVREDSDIRSMADLKGKKCGVASGTVYQAYWPIFLEAHGLKPDEIDSVTLSMGDICTALADGTIDFGFMNAAKPQTVVTDLVMTSDVRFISLSQEVVDKITTEYPYFSEATIPKELYDDLTEDVRTVGVRAGIICAPDADEQMVYDVLDVIFTHQEDLALLGAIPSSYNRDNALKFSDLIPMHPGAERYYKDCGIL